LSLCTGYGGIERGLELAGIKHRVVAHVEIEAFAIANLVAKMEQGRMVPAPIWTDLKTLPVDCFRGRVDIITGGYPCQPFSAAGNRAGRDDPRHLWPWIRQHVDTIRPSRCFFENVEGHISLGLREVVEDLESLGYTTTWGIFSAAEVGAPHQRKRVYILGDSQSDRLSRRAKDSEREGSKNLGERPGQDLWCQSQRPSQALANSDSTLSEGRGVPGGVHQKHPQSNSSCDGVGREATQQWLPEPGLGRVVDGCANRVDRLRLLGNGVVPQTAAKAWTILNRR
tara:strand:+ start:270 stop:1118 length:849 start_codon:yes stop_codon:yes gene_type:complete